MSALWLVFAAGGMLHAATLTGTISWSKVKPPPVAVVMRDRAVCGREGPINSPEIAADARGRLKDAVVYLADAKPMSNLPLREVVLDQRNCTFVPHVAATTRGSVIRFKNSDPVLHNVHVLDDKGKTRLNYALPVMGQEASYKAAGPEELSIRCEAGHAWMRAYVKVFDHAYFASTGEDGRYQLTLVSPGTHTLVAWHPEIGRVEKVVLVPEDPNAVVAIDLAL